jgi:hypothetical protein
VTAERTPAKGPARGGATGPAKGPANAQLPIAARPRLEAAGQRPCDPANGRSRLLKGAGPLQSAPRPSAVAQRYSLAHRLTERDHEIVAAVERHRVFTAGHLAAMFFDSRHRAMMRLRALVEMGVLDRFHAPPQRGRPNEYHYVLGRVGASMAAAERGDDADRAARRWKGETALVLARGQRLAHALGVSGFYAGLAAESRRGAGRLADWLTEPEAARWSDGIVRPDGFGVWAEGGREVEFFLEFDRGTETLGRLASKLDGYARFEAERGEAAWVVFAFTSARREASARRALCGSDVAVATAVVPPDGRPSEAIWLPLDAEAGRLGLAGLAGQPKPDGALARAAEGSLRAWRFARSRPDDEEEAPIDTT